jgi:hypothetical protein
VSYTFQRKHLHQNRERESWCWMSTNRCEQFKEKIRHKRRKKWLFERKLEKGVREKIVWFGLVHAALSDGCAKETLCSFAAFQLQLQTFFAKVFITSPLSTLGVGAVNIRLSLSEVCFDIFPFHMCLCIRSAFFSLTFIFPLWASAIFLNCFGF